MRLETSTKPQVAISREFAYSGKPESYTKNLFYIFTRSPRARSPRR